MPNIRFLPAADEDYQEAYVWYRNRSERAAARFEAEIQRAVNSIADAPDRWPISDKRHRHYTLKRYPFYVVYRWDNDCILIVAVAHVKRKPNYWVGRE